MLPGNLFTNYMSAGDTSSGLSGNLWSRIPVAGTGPFGKRNIFLMDDFLCFGQSVAVGTNVGCYVSQVGQYKTYEDSSSTVTQLATETGGVMQLLTTTTANVETSICQGGAGTAAATSVLGALNRDTNPRFTIFETRFKVSSVADNVAAIFLGLMEEDGAVHNAKVDTTGATIDNDYIGFETIHINGGTAGQNAALRAVYKKDGQTAQVSVASAATLVADTWVKAGFVYDPQAPASKRITWYVDNSELTTYVTDTQMNAATFPDGEEMGFTAILKNGSASTGANLKIDWWAFLQAG
jgi:hypothetical protein